MHYFLQLGCSKINNMFSGPDFFFFFFVRTVETMGEQNEKQDNRKKRMFSLQQSIEPYNNINKLRG